jgi:hypothetical protein
MIKDVIRRLQKASVRPNDFTSRYSELLDRLWQRKDSETQNQNQTRINPPAAAAVPESNGFGGGNRNGVGTSAFGSQDEFSWLDLQAVGELVSGEQGFGGVEGYNQFMSTGGGGDWSEFGFMGGDDINRFF